MPTPTCHLEALLAAKEERAVTETSQPLSEETRARALEAVREFSTGLPDLPTSTQEGAQAGSQTGPAVLKPLCNCPVLAWEDCEHTKETKS